MKKSVLPENNQTDPSNENANGLNEYVLRYDLPLKARISICANIKREIFAQEFPSETWNISKLADATNGGRITPEKHWDMVVDCILTGDIPTGVLHLPSPILPEGISPRWLSRIYDTSYESDVTKAVKTIEKGEPLIDDERLKKNKSRSGVGNAGNLSRKQIERQVRKLGHSDFRSDFLKTHIGGWSNELNWGQPGKKKHKRERGKMTQRAFMRALWYKHEGDEKAVLKAYMIGEEAGIVARQKKKQSAYQYARSLLADGMRRGWIENFLKIDDRDLAESITEAISYSGLKPIDIANACGVSVQNVNNWKRKGQIRNDKLLVFAKTCGVTVDWLLQPTVIGEVSKKPRPPLDFSDSGMITSQELLPSEQPLLRLENQTTEGDLRIGRHLAAVRNLVSLNDQEITESIHTVPVLESDQICEWDTKTEANWERTPGAFHSRAITKVLEANTPGREAFAWHITKDWYSSGGINKGDHVFFADDILPDIGDFVVMRHLGPKVNDRQRRRLISGFFFPKGGRPDPTAAETYWDQFDGVELRADPKSMTAQDYDLDMGSFEYIGVGVEIQRSMLSERAEAASVMTHNFPMPIEDQDYWQFVFNRLPEPQRKILMARLDINKTGDLKKIMMDENKLLEIYEQWLESQEAATLAVEESQPADTPSNPLVSDGDEIDFGPDMDDPDHNMSEVELDDENDLITDLVAADQYIQSQIDRARGK